MDEIKINPKGGRLTIKIQFKTPQIFSYAYRIFDTEETQVFQHETGDSQEDESLNERQLTEPTDFYTNKKLRVSVDLADPQGAGNEFGFLISVVQDGQACPHPIQIEGTTTNNDQYLVRWRKFIQN